MTQNAKTNDRVVIIGGGVVALCAAYYLDKLGRQITILERSSVGSGASRGNGGQVVPADPFPAPGMVLDGLRHWFSPSSAFFVNPRRLPSLTPFLLRFARHTTPRRYKAAFNALDALNQRTVLLFDGLAADGIGSDFKLTGNLKAFRSRETADAAWQATRQLAAQGLVAGPGDFLSTTELHDLEPSLGDAAKYGFLRQDVRWGDPSQFVDQLVDYLRVRGVEIVERCVVSDVAERPSSVLVTANGRAQEYESLLIAAGTGSKALINALGHRMPLIGGKGYSFTVKPVRMPGYTVLLGEAHVGATPLDSVRLRIAGTMEFGAPDDAVQRSRIKAIATAATPFIKGVDWDDRTEEWAASRPMTPDGLPYVGRVGRAKRLFVCAGHNMLGLSLAPSTGQLIAGLMAGGVSESELEPFSLGR